MKFTIMQKLLTLISLPIIFLLIFSANHINNKYSILTTAKLKLSHLKTINSATNLIYELQIERGISANYLSKNGEVQILDTLAKHRENTDTQIRQLVEHFKILDEKSISNNTKRHIQNIKESLRNISILRNLVDKHSIKNYKSFKFYSTLNDQLISVVHGLKLNASSEETNSDITTLFKVIQLQEYAGQERALVSKLLHIHNINNSDLQLYHMLKNSQKEEYEHINLLLKDTELKDSLKNIHLKYQNNFFGHVREEFKNHEIKVEIANSVYKTIGYGGMIHDLLKLQKSGNKQFFEHFLLKKINFDNLMKKYLALCSHDKIEYNIAKNLKDSFKEISINSVDRVKPMQIFRLYKKLENYHLSLDSKKWFEYSSARIDEMNSLSDKLFTKIQNAITEEIQTNENLLMYQVIFTLLSILILLFGTFYIANKIKFSIGELENGINDFFDFLSFKSKKPENIETRSNDEINDMAQNINRQMSAIEDNLEEDKYFIQEITQIVTMMRDGDFSERPYFEPTNPNLIELKDVFNELMELISSKIKEQTDSLERLNSSLEDRVYKQTIELENQIKEITQARDKAIQAEIAKDEFLANMSHEIRTPLNAILGFVTILQKRITEEKSLNYLSIIDNSGKSLLTIINDILDFSKIQSGKFTISPHKVEPIEEFSNACSLFASKAYEKHLIYAVYIDPSLPQLINIDAVRVKQILSNILSNSIKFTPEDGEIKVKVTIENSKLIISVQDNGIGIAKENLSKIFSAFEQADGSTTRKYGGTGLGLSISAQLASLMNGELTVSSEVGVGSIFTLTLPIEILDNSRRVLIAKEKVASYTFAILNNCIPCKSQVKLIKKYLMDLGAKNIIELEEFSQENYDILFFVPDDSYNEEIVNSNKVSVAMLRSNSIKLANLEHIQPLYAPFTPKSIAQAINDTNLKDLNLVQSLKPKEEDEIQFRGSVLIAEDNKTNQMLISLFMDDYGIEYKIANNGLEVFEMFKEGNYDMVLIDENMPELNGIGAMKLIKAYEEENCLIFTPIIVLTASVLQNDIDNFLSAGMDGFVGKPINTKELEAELNKYLKRI